MPGRYTHDQFCLFVQAEIELFAEAVRGAGNLGLRVPSCPGWHLRDLTQHMGQIHRWAGRLVRERSTTGHWRWISDSSLPGGTDRPPGQTACADWILAGGQGLLAELRQADPDGPMWAWGADQHVRFWSRRMTHETAVHRIDAQFAVGTQPRVDAGLAVDGVNEFLEVLPRATWQRDHLRQLRGEGERIGLTALDEPQSWTITLTPGGFEWAVHPSAEPADVGVRAAAADLYLLLWGRLDRASDRLEIGGRQQILDRWCAHALI